MKVLILAGGFATRLWPLTEKRAKPLLLLDGKTILEHILKQIPKEAEIILLTNKRFTKDFEKLSATLPKRNIDIWVEDAQKDGEKKGALGAVSAVISERKIQEDIFVFAGDNLLPELKIEQLRSGHKEASLAVREVEDIADARKFGVAVIDEKDRVVEFEEKPLAPKSKLVSTGFLFFGKETLSHIHTYAKKHPDNLGGIFRCFLEENVPVRAERVGGEWFDVGSFETYLEAHRKLQKKDLLLGKEAKETGNTLLGKVFLGKESRVENCELTDCIIYPRTVLKNCHLAQVVIDENCELKGLDLNRKLVRAGTYLRGE